MFQATFRNLKQIFFFSHTVYKTVWRRSSWRPLISTWHLNQTKAGLRISQEEIWDRRLSQVVYFKHLVSLWHLITGGSTFEWSVEVIRSMCGLVHHIGSQGLFTYIQPWPASTMPVFPQDPRKHVKLNTFTTLVCFTCLTALAFAVVWCVICRSCVLTHKNRTRYNVIQSAPVSLWTCQCSILLWVQYKYEHTGSKHNNHEYAHVQKQSHSDLFYWRVCLLVLSQYITVYSV